MQEFIQLTINGLLQGGIYSLISIGLTLIFGVTRIINFAHGEFLMLAMYVTFFLFQMAGIDPYLSLLVVTPLLFLLGLVSERLVIHPILNAPSFMQIFATVGLSLDSQGSAAPSSSRSAWREYRNGDFSIRWEMGRGILKFTFIPQMFKIEGA